MLKSTARSILVAAAALLTSTVPMVAQGCQTYPYRDGIDPDLIAENKYVATGSASVSFDDVDSVNDAKEEATLEAKATLAKFLKEDIRSDSTIAKIVNESKTMNGTGKENVRNEAIKRTKLLRSSSQALLRGVMKIGECYTTATEVRVTVGVKPESINAAEGLAGGIKGNSVSGAKQQPLTSVGEFSDTKNLKKF
jgi:hypothetical protein